MRFRTARSTVDIDLTVQRVDTETAGDDVNRVVREMLQQAAGIGLGDWFVFAVGQPVMDLTAAPYGGARYPIEARMDDRIFARFHLDAGIGDVIMQPLETLVCKDWLGFAGIDSSKVWLIPREQQFAEKITPTRSRVALRTAGRRIWWIWPSCRSRMDLTRGEFWKPCG